jgi:hypothetical protein
MLSIYYYYQAKSRYKHIVDCLEQMGGESEPSNAMLAAERDMAGLEMVYFRERAVIAGYAAFTCVAFSVMIAITYFFG